MTRHIGLSHGGPQKREWSTSLGERSTREGQGHNLLRVQLDYSDSAMACVTVDRVPGAPLPPDPRVMYQASVWVGNNSRVNYIIICMICKINYESD